MIDMTFIEAVASSISYAVRTVTEGGLPDEWHGFATTSEEAQRLCRRVAVQLYVDLDGKTLLNLALEKIAFEQGSNPIGEVPRKVA